MAVGVVVQRLPPGYTLAAVAAAVGKHSDNLALFVAVVAAAAAAADMVLAVGVRVPAVPDDTEQTVVTSRESFDGCNRTRGKTGCIPVAVAAVAEVAAAAAERIAVLGRVVGTVL